MAGVEAVSYYAMAVSSKAISYHASAVSAKAGQAILIFCAPWQDLPRLGILFNIFLLLGSIRRRLAFYTISYHALAVSAVDISYYALAVSSEAWHAILYLNLSYESSSLTNSNIQACRSDRDRYVIMLRRL